VWGARPAEGLSPGSATRHSQPIHTDFLFNFYFEVEPLPKPEREWINLEKKKISMDSGFLKDVYFEEETKWLMITEHSK